MQNLVVRKSTFSILVSVNFIHAEGFIFLYTSYKHYANGIPFPPNSAELCFGREENLPVKVKLFPAAAELFSGFNLIHTHAIRWAQSCSPCSGKTTIDFTGNGKDYSCRANGVARL